MFLYEWDPECPQGYRAGIVSKQSIGSLHTRQSINTTDRIAQQVGARLHFRIWPVLQDISPMPKPLTSLFHDNGNDEISTCSGLTAVPYLDPSKTAVGPKQ